MEQMKRIKAVRPGELSAEAWKVLSGLKLNG